MARWPRLVAGRRAARRRSSCRPVRRGLLGDGLSRRPPAVLAGVVERRQVRRDDRSCSGLPRPWRAWASFVTGPDGASTASCRSIAGALIVVTAAKLWFEAARPRVERDEAGPLRRTAWLLRGAFEAAGRSQAVPRCRGGRGPARAGDRRGGFGRPRGGRVVGGSRIGRFDRRGVDRAVLVLSRGHAAEDAGGAAVMKTDLVPESLLASLPVARPREGRPADPRAAARAGPVRAGAGSRRQDPGRDDGDGLRLLLDGLRADRPSPRRPGGQPEPDDRLPGEPRHGLPQGVGGPDRPRRPRPRDRPVAARRATAGAGRSTGTRR